MPPISRLQAVPPSFAPILPGMALAIAPRTQAMIRGWPSVLPATLGAGKIGLTSVPGGAITRIGRNVPVLSGTSRAQMLWRIAVQLAAEVAT